jgi:hypothetical protein
MPIRMLTEQAMAMMTVMTVAIPAAVLEQPK